MDFDGRRESAGWRWSLLFSLVFLNICLPSLLLSYGVFWVHLSSFDVPLWVGLTTPSIFVLTFSLTQCWFREAADSWGGSVGYRVMGTIGLFFVVVSLIICAFVPYHVQPYIYGIVGGLGSSLLSAQVDAVIFETYDTRLVFVKGFCLLGQAIGLSIFPHLLTELIDVYGYSFAYIVYAGIMLQSLVAIMLLNIDESARRPASFSRYKDLSQGYMVYKNEAMDNFYGTELQLHYLNKKCWKNPSDDQLHREEELKYDDVSIIETITPPPSPEEKRRNIFGVDILPEIPEESEESDSDDHNAADINKQKNRLSVAIKRLSTLGENIDGCITNQVRRDSQTERENADVSEYTEFEVKYETIAPMTDIHTEKIFNTFNFRCQSAYMNMKRKLSIPSYRMYRIRRRFIYFIYSINDTFLKPLTRSLSCGKFYPALLLSLSRLSLLSISLVLLPMLASEVHPKISMLEMNFLMSLYGFTWICFLLCTPWLEQTPKRNYKYIVVMGLGISTISAFVLAADNNHDSYSIGCVIAGFGFGAVASSWETAVQDFVGARKWPKIHSTLETLSACLMTVFVVGLSFTIEKANGPQFVMFILGILLASATFVWFIIAAVSIYLTNIRTMRLGRKCLF
ncbi:uncharacterized protein LOC123691708 [Colias croceus]|uniref:uncharacterized protein LOC123691708 n=1 Tax=Colias crocea TaxID=72248 RepID=UPI001E280BF1|nr:uncharacterized protein LOC123691708 [Colias croceus]